MRQLALSVLSLVAVAATLFGSGPRQAYACSCAGIQPTEHFAREMYDFHDLVIIGEVTSFRDLEDGRRRVRAEIDVISTFGSVGPDVVADRGEAGCGYGEALRPEPHGIPESHFMMLTLDHGNEYYASYCSSFQVSLSGLLDGLSDDQLAFLNELRLLAPPVRSGRERASFDRYRFNDDGAPGTLIAGYAGASVIALAGLWAPWRRLAR